MKLRQAPIINNHQDFWVSRLEKPEFQLVGPGRVSRLSEAFNLLLLSLVEKTADVALPLLLLPRLPLHGVFLQGRQPVGAKDLQQKPLAFFLLLLRLPTASRHVDLS